MIDRFALKLLRPAADRAAGLAFRNGLTADQVSVAGLSLGLVAALLIALGWPGWAMLPLLANRALDGVDGALARLTEVTDRGAFIDITFDFIFYGSIPLAFAIADPAANALAASVLLAAFLGTGTSFLAFAIIAEKRKIRSTAYPSKSFYYLGGLTEGTETILCFLAMCLWPGHFASIASVYAVMCLITTLTRLIAGWRMFGENPPEA